MRTPTWIVAATAAVSAAVLPACDVVNLQELKVGVSTAAEVRVRMGLPNAEHANTDGTVTYEYNRQPNGTECFMITIGTDQIVQRIEQVLTERNMAKVVPGMDKEEVQRLLGKPGSIAAYRNKNEEVWDWRVAGTIPTEEAHFHVHFDPNSGLVTGTSRRVEVRS